MQTKQFSGDTIDDVLSQVRSAFGDDAVILETRNVVRGGFAGFFGRSGIEVTAADHAPDAAPSRGVDVLDTPATPAGMAPAAGGSGEAALDADEFLRRLGEHLSPGAGTGDEAAAARPFAGMPAKAGESADVRAADERERARAIIEAARAAVREAAADGLDEPAVHVAEAAAPPAEDEADFVPAVPAARDARAEATPQAAPVASAPSAPVERAARPLPVRAEVAAVRNELVAAGVDERRLDGLLDGFMRSTAPFLRPDAEIRSSIRDYLAARMPVVRDWRPRRTAHTIALVGQSGVGKTATAVKIAACHRRAGMDVAIVTSSRGPLLERARDLELTVVEAADADAVRQACARLADRDLIVLDTPGCSHAAVDDLRTVGTLVEAAAADEVHLVLAAATPCGDLGDLQAAFREVGVNRVTLTKLDETRFYGGLLNAPMRVGRPLAYIADGPGMPDAIAVADPRLVSEFLLP